MKKFSERARRILRMIYMGLGAATVTLLFQACYGHPMVFEEGTVDGTVKSENDEEPIPGIKVSVKDTPPSFYDSKSYITSTSTDSGGAFSIRYGLYNGDWYDELFTLTFEDIDGPDNGGLFQTKTETINWVDRKEIINVHLEKEDGE
jgi:putative lipoprotein (rSAM/lipoprotein system)